MTILGKYIKQPNDIIDYDFDFSLWLADKNDTISTATAVAETGLTVGAVTNLAGVVKVFTSGGVSGNQYKVTATINTVGARRKEAEIIIKVKDY